MKLWYGQPAKASVPDVKDGWQNDPEWLKALPVGNGFLGAMVFGKPTASFFMAAAEKLQLPPGDIAMIGDSIENPANALVMVHAAQMFGAGCRFRDTTDFQYHYRLTATIALAEISRQVGRRPTTKVPPAGRPPFYDHRLARLAEVAGQSVSLEDLAEY